MSNDDAFMSVERAKKKLRDYRTGTKISAWIAPETPDDSTLVAQVVAPTKPNLKDIDLRGIIAVQCMLLFAGLGLIGYGLLSGRQKAVAPDFANNVDHLVPGSSENQVVDVIPVEVEEPEWSGMASAKYFDQKPTGILD